MPVGVVSRSKARKIQAVIIGFAELPVVQKNGTTGWALPGNRVTFSLLEAKRVAETLDRTIRKNLSTRPKLS